VTVRALGLNPQVFLETILCVAFGSLTLYLAASGEYLAYVAPRIKPYLYFTSAVMLLFALSGIRRLTRPQHIIRAMHCLVLAIPILFLMLPHHPMVAANQSSGFSGNGVTGAADAIQSGGSVAASGTQNTVSEPQADSETTTDALAPLADLPGFDPANRQIDIPNDSFYEWLTELFTNYSAYEGYTVSITGYVLKDPENLAENQFVSARLAMTCCVADLTPIGIICQYENAASLKESEWLTVKGELHLGDYMGEPEPQLYVTSITPAEPVEGYVYVY
jgi:putative membrane protein